MKIQEINDNPEVMEIAKGISDDLKALLDEHGLPGSNQDVVTGAFVLLKLAALEYKINLLTS